jgi:HlyD family secretion protein
MKQLNKFLLILLAATIVALFVWSFTPKAVPVQTAEITRGAFQQIIEEDGKTRVRERYVVSAPLAGKVNRIALKAGDVVEKNQTIATIAPHTPALLDARAERELAERVGATEAARSRAIAEVARIQATLEKSRADLSRVKKLAAGGFVSPTQLEQTELVLKVNQRELEAARQAVHVAEHDIATARAALLQSRSGTASGNQWEVRAPVAGSVLKVVQESEGVVALGAPLLEIGNPADMEIVADVLSSDAVQIKPGAPVKIERWGRPEPLQARVRRVEPSAFTKISALGVEEQRVNVVMDITSPPDLWRGLSDGYKVDAKIVVFTADNAVKVPVSALFRKDSQWATFVAVNGRAQERLVQIARRSGLEAMVEKGLQPGEKVIVYPADVVKDGKRIRPAP